MELLTPLLILCVIISASAAAFFFAESLQRKVRIAEYVEMIDVLRAELKDWQNKALFRQGVTPLGRETEQTATKRHDSTIITPRVVHRGQMQARAEQREVNQGITIHGHEVKNPLNRDIIEKAQAIINNKQNNGEPI